MQRQKLLRSLTRAYSEDGIVLVLGAGISWDSNIPSWRELLNAMVVNHVPGADQATFADLTGNDLSLPVVASLLQEDCGGRLAFINAVRDTLYADFPFYNKAVNKYNRGDFVRFIKEGEVKADVKKSTAVYKANTTLRSIGAFCAVRRMERNRKGEPSLRNFANPKVRAIATLNLDTLLQTYISTLTTKRLVRSMVRSTSRPHAQSIAMYHMHGYLSFFPRTDETASPSTRVVLTEQDYFDFFNQPNSMFNYTFLYLLREFPCLFIGLSMQDENIRRMLHYSKLERMEALAKKLGISLEELGGQQDVIEKEVRRHYVILQENGNKLVNTANEKTLNTLGVKVLWVKSFLEIRDILKRLYESVEEDAGHWAEVYGREPE